MTSSPHAPRDPADRTSDQVPDGLCAALGIRSGMRVALLHAPKGIEDTLAPVPDDVLLQHGLRRNTHVDLIIGFVTDQAHLASNIGWLVETLPEDGSFWVASPTAASGIPTDMETEAVDAIALAHGWRSAQTVAIDADRVARQLVRDPEQPAT